DHPSPGLVARLGTTRFRNAAGFGELTFTPDSKTVYAVAGGEDILAWDLATGIAHRFPLVGENDGSVVFSADGKTAASVGRDKLVRLWDVASGKVLQIFPVKESWPLAISPRGTYLALQSSDKGFRLR